MEQQVFRFLHEKLFIHLVDAPQILITKDQIKLAIDQVNESITRPLISIHFMYEVQTQTWEP